MLGLLYNIKTFNVHMFKIIICFDFEVGIWAFKGFFKGALKVPGGVPDLACIYF